MNTVIPEGCAPHGDKYAKECTKTMGKRCCIDRKSPDTANYIRRLWEIWS